MKISIACGSIADRYTRFQGCLLCVWNTDYSTVVGIVSPTEATLLWICLQERAFRTLRPMTDYHHR